MTSLIGKTIYSGKLEDPFLSVDRKILLKSEVIHTLFSLYFIKSFEILLKLKQNIKGSVFGFFSFKTLTNTTPNTYSSIIGLIVAAHYYSIFNSLNL